MFALNVPDMQPGVTPFIKQRVIEDWFQGLQRDNKHGIGTGTVTNIIRNWVADLNDEDIAGAMRYLAVAFRKLKLTIPQCALGARACNMMNNLGIEENDFEDFISETYKSLKELEMDPKKMAYFIKQMQELAGTMQVAQIPRHISELDSKKQLLQEIEDLEAEELDMKVKVDILKGKEKHMGSDFQQFADIKLELGKYDLKFDDLELFMQTVKEAKELGYHAHLIGSKLRYWDELQKKELERELNILKLEHKEVTLDHQTGYNDKDT